VFSATHFLRIFERKIGRTCIGCGRCVEICPFGAVQEDYTSRPADCALCGSCSGVCPSGAIRYAPRWSSADDRPAGTHLPRRRFLAGSAGAVAGIAGGVASAFTIRLFGANHVNSSAMRPVRPPGSVPEPEFLALCIRCGECFRACPNDALQPLGFAQGLEGLWTPHLAADWSGCEPSCANCGQVCPTGAIRPLPIDQKRTARMGLAVVDRKTCLPYALREACQLCVDECVTAGYHAIEFERVGTQVDEAGQPVEESGFLAPVVLPDRCVGCGLCQTRCLAINGAQKKLLAESAIRVVAEDGK
jgi:MauM/NapG family ferredoxin protein